MRSRQCSGSTSRDAGVHPLQPQSTTLQRQYFSTRKCSRRCSDSIPQPGGVRAITATVRGTATTVLVYTQVFAILQRQYLSARMCSRNCCGCPRHCSDSTSQHASAHDTAATILLNTHVFTTLRRQYFSSRRCAPIAFTVRDTAATLLFYRQVIVALR